MARVGISLFVCLTVYQLHLVSGDPVWFTTNECTHYQERKKDPNFAKTNNCVHGGYGGPVGSTISSGSPRKLARATKDHGQALIENVATMAGNVPVIGSFFSSALTLYADNFGSSVEGTINKIVDDIEAQIKDLKDYVDARIQEHEVTGLSQDLQGFLAGAKMCASLDDESQREMQMRCLETQNLQLANEFYNFAPPTDSIASYEQTLPLFRQYGDLRLTVLQDLMRLCKLLGNTVSYNDYLGQLQTTAQQMHSHSQTAVDRIIQSHTEGYGMRSCDSRRVWGGLLDWTLEEYCGDCSQVFDGKLCKYTHCVDAGVPGGLWDAEEKARICIDNYKKNYIFEIRRDLKIYWDLEMLQVARKWMEVASKAGEQLDSIAAEAHRDANLPTKKKNKKKSHKKIFKHHD